MAYDEELAGRVRELVQEHGAADEKPMFGGLAFMLGGHMAVCVSHDGGLLVRTDGSESDDLLLQEHVGPMVMGSQSSRTWLRVDAAALGADAELATWLARGVATARAQPQRPGVRSGRARSSRAPRPR
ncbi:TfoX/Sxy family protein [Nocardioides sp. cx-173]|uniref:TfoX/Sxy family protein n=1 Tax=Nocardioides sp. cx-173 TaxID=2898796 RepID=UPI001E476826|nr:TfoX/Sxy family protein [Nocardioides sp. cx-173]MCD4523433.1 TfoX/Sxy family protein [Nocardioides sp. cx-173]UGB42228.1 TfoX/Sxy family protein [Nocardioides sp. cx-173]